MTTRALYFGYGDDGGGSGHFLRFKDRLSTLNPSKAGSNFPWTIHHLDTGLLENRKVVDAPDGRVFWTAGGEPILWFAFVWWDRSGDKRGASNSGFYVEGFSPETVTPERTKEAAREAFAFACAEWPEIVARQRFPLKLMND